jgi:hypothetical protein
MSGEPLRRNPWDWNKEPEQPARAEAARRQPEEPPEGEEDTHPSQAYGGVWSRRDKVPKVEFRFLDPQRFAESLDYGWLNRVRWHQGRGLIELVYADGPKVTIRGINLWDLKEKLRQHLVTWVQEQGADTLLLKEESLRAREEDREPLIVQEIRFEEPEELRAE